jgi:hypothetical protein
LLKTENVLASFGDFSDQLPKCDPIFRQGASLRPAHPTLSFEVAIRVPPFIAAGEIVRVDVKTGR